MCFHKIYLTQKKTRNNVKHTRPQNLLEGCRMIVLIDDPEYTYFIHEYCNYKIVEDGLCELHKDLNKITTI